MNTKQLKTSTASKAGNWRDELHKSVRQSIEFFSDQNNLTKEEQSNIQGWVVAGPDEKSLLQFNRYAKKLGLKAEKTALSNEGYGIDELQLKGYQAGSKQDYTKLSKIAKKLDLAFWHEVEQIHVSYGAINQNEITEGAFDPDLRDGDQADDINGDGIADPLFQLLASDPANGSYGVNAVGAWDQVSGEDVRVGVLDSFFDLNHSDLQAALPTSVDWDGDGVDDAVDANNNGIADVFEPEGFTYALGSNLWPVNDRRNRGQSHGTSVSGIAVGRINGESGVGIAPESEWLPFGFIDRQPDWPSADYYNYANVVNNSWGLSGINGTFRTNTPQQAANWQMATERSIQVVAAGNDRDPGLTFTRGWDNSNNSAKARRENIVVAATMRNGEVEQYSTPGASIFASAPVNGSNFRFDDSSGANANQQRTVTADVTDDPAIDGGPNNDNAGYVNGPTHTRFNGTSAAAPMVTGTIALMLEANPSLDWRNVQHILAQTSTKNGLIDSNGDGQLDAIDPNAGGNAANPAAAGTIEMRDTFTPGVNTTFDINDGHNTGWFQNGAGHWVSDSFGFGIVNAGAAVELASRWRNVAPERKVSTNSILASPFTIQEGNLGGLDSLDEAGSWEVDDHLSVEWVELNVKLDLPEQDEIMLAVQSPSGTRSVLMAPGGSDARPFPNRRNSFGERTFITNQFWGEDSRGEWSIEVLDTNADGDTARLSEASLDIFGTKANSITNFIPYLDPEKKLFELPKDYLKPIPNLQDLLNPISQMQSTDELTMPIKGEVTNNLSPTMIEQATLF
ncbi:S8 family serine peptidase [Synechococcus sp. PROS-U-1]|uniref:S8 family serine peptidase n=1 Tax=Synechococcus sp. PROS-U-1 TaxID=1400866 RepID=UPI001646E82E|nr:S8 family serine peptidase [Synechococcus sp. PROS-U-1]